MNLILVGLSHKTADVELREKLAFGESDLSGALYNLLKYPEIKEVCILSTCNRVEITAAVNHISAGFENIICFLLETFDLKRDMLVPHLYCYSVTDAVRHIFRVTSSLDSLVVGESQILGQVKSAVAASLAHKSSGVLLNKVYRKAIAVAKRIRTETTIAENPVSVSSVAVELAEKIFGSLQEKTVFIVGAGEMAELALKHLLSSGVRGIMITTRDFDKAERLAAEYYGKAIPFESFLPELVQADIVICSTGAPHYLITPDDVEEVLQERGNQPIFMIDISVPRNISPAVNDMDNVFLYDVDDLNSIVQANIQERAVEAEQGERIADEEVITMARWMKSLEVVPTIVEIKDKAEAIRKAEVEKFLSKADGLNAEHVDAVKALSLSIINKLLHAPVIALKQEADSPNGSLYVETARKLFNLDHELNKGHHHRNPDEKSRRSVAGK